MESPGGIQWTQCSFRRKGFSGREIRHLLLTAQPTRFGDTEQSTFLCGHDERAWFAAAIPEEANPQTVQQAKDALKPQEVWDAMK